MNYNEHQFQKKILFFYFRTIESKSPGLGNSGDSFINSRLSYLSK
jgi:hypothetical protein